MADPPTATQSQRTSNQLLGGSLLIWGYWSIGTVFANRARFWWANSLDRNAVHIPLNRTAVKRVNIRRRAGHQATFFDPAGSWQMSHLLLCVKSSLGYPR